MSTISIDYWTLNSAVGSAKKISGSMDIYSEKISDRVARKLVSLPGNDGEGNISAAIAAAGRKNQELAEQGRRARDFSSKVDMLITNAKKADNEVVGSMRQVGESYVGKRNVFQQIGDWLYNTFCVDLINSNPFAQFLGNCLKWGGDKLGGWIEKVKNRIKYQDWKYAWNIIKTAAGAIVAVAAALVAVLTCGTALAVATAAASVVVACIAVVNGGISIYQNIKAQKKYEKGEYGAARYHGNIAGYSDFVAKYDLGDKEANEYAAFTGKVVDIVETICEIVIFTNGIANLGGVKGKKDAAGKLIKSKTGKVESYDFSKKNIVKNLKESFGIKNKRYSIDEKNGKKIPYAGEKSGYKVEGKFEFKNLFESRDEKNNQYIKKFLGFGKTDAAFCNRWNNISPESALSFGQKFDKLSTGQKLGKTVMDGANVLNTAMSRAEDVDTVYTNAKNGFTPDNAYDTVKSGTSLLDFMKIVDDFNKFLPSFL